MKLSHALYSILFLTSLVLSGCARHGGDDFFIRENVDFAFISRIAILPFENNSKDEYVAERCRDITITNTLSLRLFDVVDKGHVDSLMRLEAIEPGSAIDEMTIKRLGRKLKVNAILIGTVDVSGENRQGSFAYPELSLTLRLLETEAALVVWQASGHASGQTMRAKLLGMGPRDVFFITNSLVRKLLATIPGKGS